MNFDDDNRQNNSSHIFKLWKKERKSWWVETFSFPELWPLGGRHIASVRVLHPSTPPPPSQCGVKGWWILLCFRSQVVWTPPTTTTTPALLVGVGCLFKRRSGAPSCLSSCSSREPRIKERGDREPESAEGKRKEVRRQETQRVGGGRWDPPTSSTLSQSRRRRWFHLRTRERTLNQSKKSLG